MSPLHPVKKTRYFRHLARNRLCGICAHHQHRGNEQIVVGNKNHSGTDEGPALQELRR